MKKTYAPFLFILLAFVAFIACNKELSVETGIIPGQQAKGTLKDTGGNCLPSTIHGTWYNGVAPGDSNYVSIQVKVDTVGTYVIYTDTQNGLSFRDSGSFTTPGINTINLKPTGTAIAPDPTLFTIYFDTSVCEFILPVQDSTGTGLGSAAEYTLAGSPNACSNTTVYGKWAEQTALNPDSNVVAIEVNVTKVGKYTITVGPVNGITLADSGTFTQTGTQQIYLHATGTPNTAGDNTFPVTMGSSNCSFTVFVINSTNASNASWQFTEGANNYNGFTISAYITDTSNYHILYVYGLTPSTFDTAFSTAFLYTTAAPVAGTPYSSKNGDALFGFVNTATSDTLYKAAPNDTNTDVQITVQSYDPTTGMLDANFSGTALAAGGTVVPITNGKFKVKIDK